MSKLQPQTPVRRHSKLTAPDESARVASAPAVAPEIRDEHLRHLSRNYVKARRPGVQGEIARKSAADILLNTDGYIAGSAKDLLAHTARELTVPAENTSSVPSLTSIDRSYTLNGVQYTATVNNTIVAESRDHTVVVLSCDETFLRECLGATRVPIPDPENNDRVLMYLLMPIEGVTRDNSIHASRGARDTFLQKSDACKTKYEVLGARVALVPMTGTLLYEIWNQRRHITGGGPTIPLSFFSKIAGVVGGIIRRLSLGNFIGYTTVLMLVWALLQRIWNEFLRWRDLSPVGLDAPLADFGDSHDDDETVLSQLWNEGFFTHEKTVSKFIGHLKSSVSSWWNSLTRDAITQKQVTPQNTAQPPGLKNYGQTCYFNALISALFHIPQIRDHDGNLNEQFMVLRNTYLQNQFPIVLEPLELLSDTRSLFEQRGETKSNLFKVRHQQDPSEALTQMFEYMSWLKDMCTYEEKEISMCDQKQQSSKNVVNNVMQLPFRNGQLNVTASVTGENTETREYVGCDEYKMMTSLDKVPEILVLNLKRNMYGRKITAAPTFDDPMDIKGHLYVLRAVVLHIGNHEGGHYVSRVRRGAKWFECDDDKVRLVNGPVDQSQQLWTRGHIKMMFYSRIEPDGEHKT